MKFKKFVLYGVFSGQLYDSDYLEETYKAYLQIKKNDKENGVKEKYFFMIVEDGESGGDNNHCTDIKTPIKVYRKGTKIYHTKTETKEYHEDLKKFKRSVVIKETEAFWL